MGLWVVREGASYMINWTACRVFSPFQLILMLKSGLDTGSVMLNIGACMPCHTRLSQLWVALRQCDGLKSPR